MSAEAHHAAVVAAIQGEPQLASVVYELGDVPTENTPQRYVVVVSSLGDWSQRRFTGGKDGLVTTHTIYCGGDKAWKVRWVGGKVTDRLKDVRLTIPGRNVFRPDPWISRPMQLDLDGLFPKPFGVIQFDLLSEPA